MKNIDFPKVLADGYLVAGFLDQRLLTDALQHFERFRQRDRIFELLPGSPAIFALHREERPFSHDPNPDCGVYAFREGQVSLFNFDTARRQWNPLERH